MKTLVEIAKQADKLYADFLKEQEATLPQRLKTMNGGITEEEQNEILEWIHEHDYMDTDEYDIDDEYIIPEERLNITGHYDEQAFLNHIRATDEDGTLLHTLDKEIN